MAKQKTKFADVKIGETFHAEGGDGYTQYKKISALEYESTQNKVLGSFYAAPGFTVEVDVTPKPAPAKKAVKK